MKEIIGKGIKKGSREDMESGEKIADDWMVEEQQVQSNQKDTALYSVNSDCWNSRQIRDVQRFSFPEPH